MRTNPMRKVLSTLVAAACALLLTSCITPKADDVHSGAAELFYLWANSIHLRKVDPTGYPGIYVPDDDAVTPSERAEARMGELARAVATQDASMLAGMFSTQARRQSALVDAAADDLLSTLAGRELAWESQAVNLSSDGTQITAFYRVSGSTGERWLFFADVITEDDADAFGLAALAVTSTEPGGADEDPASHSSPARGTETAKVPSASTSGERA